MTESNISKTIKDYISLIKKDFAIPQTGLHGVLVGNINYKRKIGE